MMKFNSQIIQKPTTIERRTLRLMIIIGVIAIAFFLYTIFKTENIGYYPLYVLLMITMVYYCLKFLHEWYHYFSISANEKATTQKIYTVDILTTYCAGEPFDMLEQTLRAVQNISYPHTTWCCDEADDPEVKALCFTLGVKHVTRKIKINAKAGNINNALQFATGELCVVLDPDHIPSPDFLDNVVAYFDDPKIGFVQIVQAYYNQHESLVAKGAAQQTYQFYGPMMMAMHSYGTVQAIGANCTFRRAAIDSIGGHASGLSEDMHTAMQMHAKGWKSIYVPVLLTRGLVPATLSSYYKQQLKWSRGTWELLVTSYPRLFTKFTWRQRLHYFTLPFHYLCGLIFFINFLIPVISLFTGYIPLKMDVLGFALASFPVIAMGTFIRHYVQKWVVEETERGFHIVGGILQIGAWWVHSVGFIYTLLRKKVPYIPTPKNDNDPLPLLLNLPNIFIAVVSIVAIVYGLVNDYNPYTIFMVGLASMQVFFMIFIFSISGYIKTESTANNFINKIRQHTWLIVKSHGFIRKYAAILSVLVVSIFIWGFRQMQLLPTFLPEPLPQLEVFYTGIYQPENTDGLTNTSNVFAVDNEKNNFSIISFYIPWENKTASNFPEDSLQLVYKNNAIPLINWVPWITDPVSGKLIDEQVFKNILTGKYDTLINSYAQKMRAINKPIYLRFAAQQHNNLTAIIQNTQPTDFILAWQYVFAKFKNAGAEKVIWVWNPWNVETALDFFPGKKYVDWLAVNVLDYNLPKIEISGNSFDSLYRPYHNLTVFNLGIPVMIAEAGTLSPNKKIWWSDAWNNIDTAFTEIKSVVFYNNKFDHYFVELNKTKDINWNIDKDILLSSPTNSKLIIEAGIKLPQITSSNFNYQLPDTFKTVFYDKGYYWFRNRHTMMLKSLDADLIEMKKMGINTLERTMPGFYDKMLGKLLVKNNIKLISRFAVLALPNIIDDELKMKKEKEKILSTIKENLTNKNIVAWNLGDDILYNLENQTFKPDYFHFKNKYLFWINDVCNEIRLIDKQRPILIDLNWDEKGEARILEYQKYVPQINKFMLAADAKFAQGLKYNLKENMAWGKVPVLLWDSIPAIKKSGVIPAWQDIENTDYVTLNGLLDLNSRRKIGFRIVNNLWGTNQIAESPLPEIKILKPAKTTRPDVTLNYHIMYRKDDTKWRLYNAASGSIHFEWYLVRKDQYQNTMFLKKIGEGPSIALTIPENPQYYQLYVEAILGKDVRVTNSSLNTPLY